MALKQNPPAYTQVSEKYFGTREAAETWVKKTKEEYAMQGMKIRYDIILDQNNNRWRARVQYYV